MKATWLIVLGACCSAVSLLDIATVRSDEPATKAPNSRQHAPQSSAAEKENGAKLSVEAARDRAKVLLDVYSVTLEVLHHRYFHGDRAMVPARAMQDIFSSLKQQSKVEARWISVNTKPMSIGHEPKSDFEKRAAREIASGKPYFEAVEAGYYRRAGAISLGNGCVGCHNGFFKEPSATPKFAGLVISVPVQNSSLLEKK